MFAIRKHRSLLTLILSPMLFLSALSLVVTWAAGSGEQQGKQRIMKLSLYRDQPLV
ncbi:MAG: hypothetical protein WCF57_07610 [Pyrinomonadaceae bacterium]